nr:hypothetical protein CFP56_11880 [Quercus suber]
MVKRRGGCETGAAVDLVEISRFGDSSAGRTRLASAVPLPGLAAGTQECRVWRDMSAMYSTGGCWRRPPTGQGRTGHCALLASFKRSAVLSCPVHGPVETRGACFSPRLPARQITLYAVDPPSPFSFSTRLATIPP